MTVSIRIQRMIQVLLISLTINPLKVSATLDLTKVYYGMQMQMMTYMDIVLQNKQRLGLTDIVKPGGLLYFHVHEPQN